MYGLKFIKQLGTQSRVRRDTGLYLVESPKHIASIAACNLALINAIIYRAGSVVPAGLETTPMQCVSPSQFNTIKTTVQSQGVIAVVKQRVYTAPLASYKTLVLCDGIQSPGNIGRIIRTAAGLLSDCAIVMAPQCADVYHPESVRASAGSIGTMPLYRSTWDRLAGHDRAWYAASPVASVPVSAIQAGASGKIGIILGSEGQGLSESSRQLLPTLCYIPMQQTANSLNVGVAFGIIAYTLAL